MAQSKHRKAHKQALRSRNYVRICEEALKHEGFPQEVGKKKFQVPPQDPNWTSATIGTQTDQGLEATLDDGGKLLLSPTGMSLQEGDRVQLNLSSGEVNRNGDVFCMDSIPLRGKSRFRMAIDDAADFSPAQKMKLIHAKGTTEGVVAAVDDQGVDVRTRDGLQHLDVHLPVQVGDFVEVESTYGVQGGASHDTHVLKSHTPRWEGRRGGMSEPTRNYLIQAENCPPVRGPDHVELSLPKDQIEERVRELIRGLKEADYADLEKGALAQLLKENPSKTPEELIYGNPQAMSMGCTVDYIKPEGLVLNFEAESKRIEGYIAQALGIGAVSDTTKCPICGVQPSPEPNRPQAHFEMGTHKDPVTGEVVFDEVSLCPGPDPNGITDLRS